MSASGPETLILSALVRQGPKSRIICRGIFRACKSWPCFLLSPQRLVLKQFRSKAFRRKIPRDDEINWPAKYFEKDKALTEKDEELREKDKELREKDKELREIYRKLEKASAMEVSLKFANDEVLRLKSMLSAQGVIEYFDKKAHMPSSKRQMSRQKRYQHIYENDDSFRNQLSVFFGKAVPSAVKVGHLAEKVVCNTSADIHSFDKTKGVIIEAVNYSADEVRLIQSVCASIPCNFSIV